MLSGMCHMEGWDRYRLGHPVVEVLAEAPRLNVQSGHSKVLHQGPQSPSEWGSYLCRGQKTRLPPSADY